MSDHAVDVVDLTVRYGDKVAVDAVSFHADQGHITALLGPNGAGKTTTMETLEGYRSPTSGSVRVLDLDPVSHHRELTVRVGVMLQSGGVYTGIRPAEVLSLFASYYRDPEDPDELLHLVGLTDLRRTAWRNLSGGEKQRLSLALALVGRPRVVFLDEPTAGIDPQGRQVIRSVIESLRDRGVCVLVTTHDLDEAQRLADHVVIIDRGRVLAAGTPDELRRLESSGESGQIRFATTTGLDTAALGARLGAVVREPTPGEYVIATPGDPAVIAVLTAWLADHDHSLDDLRAGRQSLEDVFLRLTTDERPDDLVEQGPDDQPADLTDLTDLTGRRGRTSPGDR